MLWFSSAKGTDGLHFSRCFLSFRNNLLTSSRACKPSCFPSMLREKMGSPLVSFFFFLLHTSSLHLSNSLTLHVLLPKLTFYFLDCFLELPLPSWCWDEAANLKNLFLFKLQTLPLVKLCFFHYPSTYSPWQSGKGPTLLQMRLYSCHFQYLKLLYFKPVIFFQKQGHF